VSAAAARLPSVLPANREARGTLRRDVIRLLVIANLVLGTYYITWRWTSSINFEGWWIAIPLVLAETYSYVDAWLFGLGMYRLKERGAAPPPPEGATVDVLITVYNEPVELVRGTARAARDIRFPHRTYVLDDGSSPEMRAMCEEEGIGYITRSEDWSNRPRHAKAGNLNNALFQTQGEFLLILDADQVPEPEMLDRILGWFRDERVALVQTPQYFVNVPEDDPLGSQAPLFYGPIQQGKDGWNSAFFCGSNAILRREALMQLGILGYVEEVEADVDRVLKTADRLLRKAARETKGDQTASFAIRQLQDALGRVRAGLAAGAPLGDATHLFRQEVDRISRDLVSRDVAAMYGDLAELEDLGVLTEDEDGTAVLDDLALDELVSRDLSPLLAIASVRELIGDLDAVVDDEAQPIMPMATISVTEDMATAMRMHKRGWRSVYHHEVLVHGLAPEDLRSMLQQRLRWAQGTIQVLLRENPLRQKGLSPGQRLMYFSTAWSYFSGFAAIAYLAAPVAYLVFGVLPVDSLGEDFLWHLLPFLLVNQLLFLVVGWGVPTWRGQQYSLALFPLWIKAVTSTVRNQLTGRELGFVVTPKTRQAGATLKLVRVQLAVMGILVLAVVIGLVRLATGATDEGGAVLLNVLWVVYDLVMLSAVIDAALYRGYAPDEDPAPISDERALA
jgi:cellulose synthase (UDP-forming)